MEAKKTIAILGLEKGTEKPFINQLAKDNRLLIVSEDINDCDKLSESSSAEQYTDTIERIDCAKDGCWEADLILLWNPNQHPASLIDKLQAVAIQKILVMISYGSAQEFPNFPHSKIVQLIIHSNNQEVTLESEHQEALAYITELVEKTGVYKPTENTNKHT